MEKANWDAYHTKIFCEICKEETEKHNRPGGYLSPKGYNNLQEKFFELTKKRHTRRKFKNKWDQLKKEYARFMALKNSATGLGWNEKMGTIEADDSWWDIHLKKYPGHAKWRYMGPLNLKEMDVMFENAHVTGETTSIPREIYNNSDDDDDVRIHLLSFFGLPCTYTFAAIFWAAMYVYICCYFLRVLLEQ
ncbi:hypothetical protein ZWY2020_058495 [Hordeum vulgare]|nr:hypothetical protein ZWY2020_058495 [Hordeum vulgare]